MDSTAKIMEYKPRNRNKPSDGCACVGSQSCLTCKPMSRVPSPNAARVLDDYAERWEQGAKPSNPKDIVGSKKLAMSAVPSTAVAHMAVAFTEGALKYGRFNWRAVGVRSSIYTDAALRHLHKYINGEDEDPETKVHHLASVMACAAIILDAELVGKLTDDRPPVAPASALIDKMSEKVQHLQELFKDFTPHQYTIEDDREE